MKDKYQKFLRFCQPFEWVVGIVIEMLPFYAAIYLVKEYQPEPTTAFFIGAMFSVLWVPYDRVLTDWRKGL